MKKAFLLLIVFLMLLSSCSSIKTYESNSLGIKFDLPKKSEVVESENTVVFTLHDNVNAVIIKQDATPMIGEDYASSNPTENLNLTSGAFDTNYNNTIYVGYLFEYILSGSERGYSLKGIGHGTFSGIEAIAANFVTRTDEVCGKLYLFIENNICYIISIYIYDASANIDNYTNILNEFESSFSLLD